MSDRLSGRAFSTRHMFCLFLTLSLVVGGLTARADECDYHLDRIEFYANALDNQEKAFEICASHVDDLRESCVDDPSDDADVRKKQRKTLKKFKRLRDLYLDKIIKTLKFLATEHEKLAEKQKEMALYVGSLQNMIRAAKIWEEVGSKYEKKGVICQDEGRYDKAGSFNENAYSAFKNAQSRWKKYLVINAKGHDERSRLRAEKIVKLALKDNYYDGLEAMRKASQAYYRYYQKYNKSARETDVDQVVEKAKAGDKWLLAASANEKYERSLNLLRKIEQNKWTTFDL